MKIFDTCNYTVDTAGAIYGIANIKEILGIIVLVLTILNILINSMYKIYTHIKKREYGQISKVIDGSINELNKTVEDFKEMEDEDNEN